MKTTLISTTTCRIDEKKLPEVHISVNRNRVKLYDNKNIYLKSGTEFELEFRNNYTDTVKAEITINGEKQLSSLVLDANESMYLDRFMDIDKKFLFDIYDVDNNETVKDIIKNNGLIQISFYTKEHSPIIWTTCQPNHYWNGNPIVYSTTEIKDNLSWRSSVNETVNNWKEDPSIIANNPLVFYSAAGDSSRGFTTKGFGSTTISSTMETGRVAVGGKSDQQFTQVYTKFNSFPFVTFEYQIHPISKLPNEPVKATRIYCSRCGRKVKNGFKFCPSCGKEI